MNYLLTGEQTQRLTFRQLTYGDYGTWLEFFKDPDSIRFLALEKYPTPKAKCDEWFRKCMERYEKHQGGLNVLINKTNNEFIGQCGLLIQDVDGKKELEIGYSILPEHRNKGYATEAAQKCRDHAFENNFTESLISIIHVDNKLSEKVAVKNGMKLEKKTIFWEVPVNVYRIWRQDWKKSPH